MSEDRSTIMKWVKRVGVIAGLIVALNTIIGFTSDESTPLGALYASLFEDSEDPHFDDIRFQEHILK